MAKRKPASSAAWKTRLRRLRTRLGVTQAEMAVRLGASLRTYVYWENGRYQPDRRYQAAIESLEKSS